MEPGLYKDSKLVYSWKELLEAKYVSINSGKLKTCYKDGLDSNIDSILMGKLVLPNDGSITELAETCFCALTKLKEVTLPNSLLKIGPAAFATTGIKKINIPESVKSIGPRAFYNSTLEEIEIPEKVKNINIQTFHCCKFLKKVILPNKLKKIDNEAFRKCEKLEEINLPATCEEINFSAFEGCLSLKKINLENVKKIEDRAFHGCLSLKEAIFKKAIYIKDHAFDSCGNLEYVGLNEGLCCISPGTFKNCISLKYINLPESLLNLNEACFLGSGLVEIDMPSNLEVIRSNALCEMPYLEKINLNSNLKEVSSINFCHCPKLEKIYVPRKIMDLVDTSGLPKNVEIIHEKTLEELIEEGKSFREINKILQNQNDLENDNDFFADECIADEIEDEIWDI